MKIFDDVQIKKQPYFVLFFYTNVRNIVIILEFMTRTFKFIISGVFYDHQTSENRKLKMDRVASDRIILYILVHMYSKTFLL